LRLDLRAARLKPARRTQWRFRELHGFTLMKILVVSMKYDYGEKERGLSGNEFYFERPLSRLGHEVLSFDFMENCRVHGREGMNRGLLETVKRERPALALFVPHEEQFLPAVLHEINKFTTTIGYFFDDVWRISFSRFWAGQFHYVTTSDVHGEKRWADAGCSNFIYSPFGCRAEMFRKKNLPKIYDVTFVGQYHPFRTWIVQRLRREGLQVSAWGYGWKNGRIDFEAMVDIFNQSRINLNLSNNESWDLRYLLWPFRPVMDTLRALKRTGRSVVGVDAKIREMVKARHFEINGCGGFQLSYYVEGLERHYEIGEEISIYGAVEDLVDKVRYYLKHEEERKAIAHRGYERTLQEHTLESRFKRLVETIQLRATKRAVRE